MCHAIVIKMTSDISKHSLNTHKRITHTSAIIHHSSNSRFILSGDNTRVPFSYCPHPSPTKYDKHK